MAPPIVCMSWQTVGEADAHVEIWENAKPVLEGMLLEAVGGKAVIVGHNVAYDFTCVLADGDERLTWLVWLAYEAGGVECTMVREKLLDIARSGLRGGKSPYSLASLVERHFKMSLDKTAWRMDYAELDGVPVADWPEGARRYALDDARQGLYLYLDQERRGRLPTQHLEARASFALQLMSAWGVTTDRPHVRRLKAELEEKMLELRVELVGGGLMSVKRDGATYSKSLKAIRSLVEEDYRRRGLRTPTTEKGSTSTSAETIESCAEPALRALVEYTSFEKTLSTYVAKLDVEVINARFNVLVNSGRTSCGSPNLQNQPRHPGVRECFVARPGRVLIACDYSSQEMRTLAQAQYSLVGKSRLGDAYRADVNFDPHKAFADATGGERQHAKIANFGIPGGMGPGGLVRYAKGYGQEWSLEFAKKIRDEYFETWPEMRDFFSYVSSVVGVGGVGDLTIPQSGMVCGVVGYCDCANRLFQTLAAHASKTALFDVVRRCYDRALRSPLLGSRPWNFVHDEIIVETPGFATHEAALELERVMVEAMELWTPDVPPAAEATAMRRWSKRAKRVVVDGRIVPWGDA